MTRLLREIPFADHLIRRNPYYYGRFIRLLKSIEALSPAERDGILRDRLKVTSSWARSFQIYRDYLWDRSFNELPILTKEDLQAAQCSFRRWSTPLMSVAKTSGSSGRPLRLIRSPQSLVMEQATIDWLAMRAGVNLADAKVAVLRGDEIKDPNDTAPPYWKSVGRRRLVLSSAHLNAHTFAAYERQLLLFKPTVLLAYPSSLNFFLQLAEEHRSAFVIELVLTSSEILPLGLRARAERQVGARLIDYYGQAERVAAAYSFEDGSYRFVFPHSYVELVQASGGGYRILGTSLWNEAMPLLRYDTGDIAAVDRELTPEALRRVSLGEEAFSRIDGRASDYLWLADGRKIFGMDRLAARLSDTSIVQIIQQQHDIVLIVIVAGREFDRSSIPGLCREFYKKVPQTVRLRVEIREAPTRLANGKAPGFYSELNRVGTLSSPLPGGDPTSSSVEP